jgi:hypothetical protein
MQNSLAGRDCSHGQDLVAAEHFANAVRTSVCLCIIQNLAMNDS